MPESESESTESHLPSQVWVRIDKASTDEVHALGQNMEEDGWEVVEDDESLLVMNSFVTVFKGLKVCGGWTVWYDPFHITIDTGEYE